VKKNVLALLVASALPIVCAKQAQAAAFALAEQGVSGLGNAYAGAAAAAEDASTVWWNPAGMSRLPSGIHVQAAAHVIIPSTKFTNGSSANPFIGTGNGGDAGDTTVVPNLFAAMSLNPAWSIGLGINVPFGLKTEYDSGWIGQFQGIKSEVKTLNINPSVSYKLSDQASIGFGVSWQRGEIDLTTGIPAAAGGGVNSTSIDGDAWGFNVGALFNLGPATRVGVHYRSSLDYKLDGDTSFSSPALAPRNGNVKLDLKTPATLSFSAVHKLNSQWELLADATWTEWSKIDRLPLVFTSGPLNGATLDTLVFIFDDTWRLSIGANYKWSGPWTLRFGVAYDQSPVPNAETRSVRLPDNDRYWLAFGATYQMSKVSKLDIGYAFVNFKDAPINNDQRSATPVPKGLVNGTYEATVNVLSVAYQHSF
jgi:long-chain fatty acid transport protein